MNYKFDIKLDRGQIIYSYENGLTLWEVKEIEATYVKDDDHLEGNFYISYSIAPLDGYYTSYTEISNELIEGGENPTYFTTKKALLDTIIKNIKL